MTNLLGPGAFGALRPSATRPSIVPANGPSDPDDWFKDCSSPIAADGTVIDGDWLNMMLAILRAAIRRGGVVENNTDDDMLARAIRSGRLNYVEAANVAGSADDVTLACAPTFSSIADLLFTPLRFTFEANNTGPMRLNVDGLGLVDLRWASDNSPLVAGDAVVGGVAYAWHDGVNFKLLTPLSPTQIRGLARQQSRATFTTPGAGTWTVPPFVTRIVTKQWGPGGGGGYRNTGTGAPSGGASGAYAERSWAVTPGQVVSFNIGAGGLGGASSPPRTGQPGGSTTVTVGGITVTTTGGGGGANGPGSLVVASPPNGGTATGADTSIDGGVGQLGTIINGGTVYGGFGTGAPLAGSNAPGGAGTVAPGSVPGGGGGSTSDTAIPGGAGARGEVRIEW